MTTDIPEILECENCDCSREFVDFDSQIEEIPGDEYMEQYFICPVCGERTLVSEREFTEEEEDFYFGDEPSRRDWEASILREYYRMCL